MDPRAGEHRFELETRGRYVFVRCVGQMTSVAQAEEMQRAIERAVGDLAKGRVVFDNRETGPPCDEARTAMWTWCRTASQLERVALILENEMATVRANMTAVSEGVRVRAFASLEDATVWLLRGTATHQAQG
jgi:hypothetical protein